MNIRRGVWQISCSPPFVDSSANLPALEVRDSKHTSDSQHHYASILNLPDGLCLYSNFLQILPNLFEKFKTQTIFVLKCLDSFGCPRTFTLESKV